MVLSRKTSKGWILQIPAPGSALCASADPGIMEFSPSDVLVFEPRADAPSANRSKRLKEVVGLFCLPWLCFFRKKQQL